MVRPLTHLKLHHHIVEFVVSPTANKLTDVVFTWKIKIKITMSLINNHLFTEQQATSLLNLTNPVIILINLPCSFIGFYLQMFFRVALLSAGLLTAGGFMWFHSGGYQVCGLCLWLW